MKQQTTLMERFALLKKVRHRRSDVCERALESAT